MLAIMVKLAMLQVSASTDGVGLKTLRVLKYFGNQVRDAMLRWYEDLEDALT